MPHTREREPSGLFAGTDAQRAGDLAEAMCRPGFAAVLCARGGHGATRIVDLLNWEQIRAASPRWLVGSSDITALHEAVQRRLGWASLHGAMVASEGLAGDSPDFDSVQSLQTALFKSVSGMKIDADTPHVIRAGTASGRLIGGNLSLLCATIGTTDSFGARDCVVLLEDVAEQPYRVDRMLTQLRRTGWFDGLRGVALGTFYECGDVFPVLRERLSELDVPVLGGFSIGHGPRQLTVPLGVDVTLNTDMHCLSVVEC
jgi:muramoyltetrapeptide carboxypeptidase